MLNRGREVAKELRAAGVDKVSISLNAHDKETYIEVCRPKVANAYTVVLDFVGKAKKEGLETEITAVTTPEVDVQKVCEIAKKIGVKFRPRECIPCFW
jgi:TatD family-associated radical SAM protein